MNLLEMLSRELKDKRYSEFEKMRYIYLRCCQLFSFDARWNFFTLFSQNIIREIENEQFDIEYIKKRLVVCHSFSKSILKPLLDYLTTIDVSVVGHEHSFIEAKCDGKKWVLDATFGDFPRVKMGLNTEGFHEDEEPTLNFENLDNSLGFKHVNKDCYKIVNWHDGYGFMDKVSRIITASDCKFHYSDVVFLYNYMTYLMKQDTKTVLGSDGNLRRLIHFTENERDYTINKDEGEYKLALVKKH